jgi:hypothetical protein
MGNLILLFVCLLAGMTLRTTNRVPENAHTAINGFIIDVSLPALTLLQIHNISLERDLLYSVTMPWVLFTGGAAFFWLLARSMKLSPTTTGALMLSGGLANTSFAASYMVSTKARAFRSMRNASGFQQRPPAAGSRRSPPLSPRRCNGRSSASQHSPSAGWREHASRIAAGNAGRGSGGTRRSGGRRCGPWRRARSAIVLAAVNDASRRCRGPFGIIDRRCARCSLGGRSGRRDGSLGRTKGWSRVAVWRSRPGDGDRRARDRLPKGCV